MSTARRKTSDDAATPPKPAVKRSPATRGTVDRQAKTTTVAADAADVKKAAATKRAATKPAPAGTKAAAGATPAAPTPAAAAPAVVGAKAAGPAAAGAMQTAATPAAPAQRAAATESAAASRPATTAAAGPAAERADMIVDRETMIRERAYLRYLQRGGGSGEAVADWLAAEQEVDAEFTRRGEPA